MAKDKLIGQQKEVEVAEVKPAEPKALQFKNVGKGMKIKLVDGRKFTWLTVKTGEIVSVTRKIANKNRLVEVK